MSLRIIAGKAKNIQLKVLEGKTRPVTDRIKTIVFDLIQDFIPDTQVLDLFAGSGSYGLEALSRGSSSATFIDDSEKVCELLRENIMECSFKEQTSVICSKLPNALSKTNKKFDLIFCDPPFTELHLFNLNDYLEIISKQNLFILRLPTKHNIEFPSNLKVEYQQQIGKSIVYFLRKTE